MKNKSKIILTICMTLLLIIIFNTRVNAVSAKLSASTTDTTVGTKVTITTTIYGAAWKVDISGAVSDAYSDTTDDAENKTITKTTSFTPTSAGNYTVKLSGNVTDASANSSTPVSDSITIKVSEKANSTSSTSNTTNKPNNNTTTEIKKSNNANLSDLGIRPNDFKGFRYGTLAYNVNVPNDVEQIEVYAKTQDSKAKIVSGTGKQKINVGQNALKVTVQAEDGTTTKTYTINVTREEKKETNTTQENTTTTQENSEEKSTQSDLTKLQIKGYELTPKFSADVYEYKLNVSSDVKDLEVITEGANHNVSIDVAGDKDLKDGENIITIIVENSETKQTSTYQVIVNKASASNEEVNQTIKEAVKKANKIRKIIIGLILFIIVCIIIFIIARKRYNKNEELYDYEDEDKETIDLNEEEEFFKRVNREEFGKKEKIEKAVENDIEETPINDNLQNKVDSLNEESNEEKNIEKTDQFRTSKRKGKHF